MKIMSNFIASFVLVLHAFGYTAFAQEGNNNDVLDELWIEGANVAAHDTDFILAEISRKYRIKVLLVSDQTKLLSGEGSEPVGARLTYFRKLPQTAPTSGSLRAVLQEILPLRYQWNFKDNILSVTPNAGVATDIEAFLATEIMVPDIAPCTECNLNLSFSIGPPDSMKRDKFVADILDDSADVGPDNPESKRMLTVGRFLRNLLEKGRYRFIKVNRFETNGKAVINLSFAQ